MCEQCVASIYCEEISNVVLGNWIRWCFFSKIARSSYPLEKEVHTYFHFFFFHFPPPPKRWCLKKVEIWVDPHWDVGRNKWIKCLVLNYNYNWVFPSLKIGVGKEVFLFVSQLGIGSQQMNLLFINTIYNICISTKLSIWYRKTQSKFIWKHNFEYFISDLIDV